MREATNLEGKVAAVTGAARGIGRACAVELARRGCNIVLVDKLSCGETAELVRSLGRGAEGIEGDVALRATSEEMVRRAVERFGGLDIAVANAGFGLRRTFLEMTVEEARGIIDVVMWGAFHTCQCAARQMAAQGRGGSVVVVSSVHASEPYPRATAYNMAKAAVNHMARTAAAELTGVGIRVNVIEPGWTDTPGERTIYTEEQIREMGKALPMKRLARPEEIASGVAWLASDESSYVTGTVLRVDGGYVLPRG